MATHPNGYANKEALLLEMAVWEEQPHPEGYCRIGRGNESTLAYELFKDGLVVESHFQGFVTWLSDRGRLLAVKLRRDRGWAEHRLFCEQCGHGVLTHRGNHTNFGDIDSDLIDREANPEGTRLKDGRDIWDLHGECQEEGCDCKYCIIPWPGEKTENTNVSA